MESGCVEGTETRDISGSENCACMDRTLFLSFVVRFLWMERRFVWLLEVTEQGHKVLWDVVCNRRFDTENGSRKMQCKKLIERMEYRWQKEEDGECEERNREIVYYYGKLDMQKKNTKQK